MIPNLKFPPIWLMEFFCPWCGYRGPLRKVGVIDFNAQS